MKKIYLTLVAILTTINMFAQGWPANYSGVMLQGFYWNSYSESKWTKLEAQAPELGQYFNLVWIPQSAYCGNKSMGYDDLYWFPTTKALSEVKANFALSSRALRQTVSEPSPTW